MKNYNLLFNIICLSFITLAFSSCKGERDTLYNHLYSSDNSFTFDATGSQTYTITIDSDPAEWDYDIEGDWINVERPDDNILTITADANESKQERLGEIIISNKFSSKEITINQFGKSLAGTPKFRLLSDFISFEVSPNGKIGLGCKGGYDANDNYLTTPVIINLATDQRTELPKITGEWSSGAISDDGSIIVLNDNMEMLAKHYINGAWEYVESPFGAATTACYVHGISADGSIWVGYAQDQGVYYPVKWVNGAPQVLDTPNVNGMGQPVMNGTMARGCSADGTVIYGSLWDNFEAVYWKPDGSCDFIAKELMEVHTITMTDSWSGEVFEYQVLSCPYITAENKRLSPNGKYISLTYSKYTVDGEDVTQNIYPLYVNLQTGEYVYLEDIPVDEWGNISGTGTAISNEGQYFYATPGMGVQKGFFYDTATGNSFSTAQWALNTYGVIIDGDYYVEKVCSSGNTVVGNKVDAFYIPWYITTE